MCLLSVRLSFKSQIQKLGPNKLIVCRILCTQSSDTESIATTTRRIFSACMDVYKWHRHEFGAQRFPGMFASRHLLAFKSKFIEYVSGIRWSQSWLFEVRSYQSILILRYTRTVCVCARVRSIATCVLGRERIVSCQV